MPRRGGVGIGFAILAALALVAGWWLHGRATDPSRAMRLAVADGCAAAAIATRLAGQKLCGRLLDARAPFTLFDTALSLPSVRALIAVGLIEPLADVGRSHFQIAAKARPFVKREQLGDVELVSLCYGRPVLERVYVDDDAGLDGAPVVWFTYTVQDRPEWADRPDMRAAFPFLREITARPIRSVTRIHRGDGPGGSAPSTTSTRHMICAPPSAVSPFARPTVIRAPTPASSLDLANGGSGHRVSGRHRRPDLRIGKDP